jgi:Tfp pilus assembly protein PilV
MRRVSPRSAASPASATPAGLTLVEVLMSMLVATIGILSVIVLLPLSFVRSVQATNLTNGTILRYNAESQIQQSALQSAVLTPWQAGQSYQIGDAVSLPGYPQVWMQCTTAGTSGAALPTWNYANLFTPAAPPPLPVPLTTVDNTVTWTAEDYNQLSLAYVYPVWQPSTAYLTGAIVLAPSGANGNNRRFLCTTAGTSNLTAPPWNTTIGQTTLDGATLVWQTVDHSHYVIDPIGWNSMFDTATTNGLQGALGNAAGAIGTIANGSAIERFPSGIRSSVNDATRFAMLPDSWVEQTKGAALNPLPAPVGANPPAYTSIQLDAVDLSNTILPPAGVTRIVLTDSTGKLSQTRLVTTVSVSGGNSTVSWSGNDPLTGGFVPFFARVESQENRYTWMLTVLRTGGSGVASVYVTIFFRRPLVAPEEQTYQANGTDGIITPLTVNYTAGQKPFVKKGGFMFDITNGRWYRITDIVSDTGTVLSVLVDQARPQTDVVANGANFNVVFMRGVVDVYPIGNE